MGLTLLEGWIVFYKADGKSNYQCFDTQKEFDEFLNQLKEKAKSLKITQVCCLIPTRSYFPYIVEELQ